MAYQVTMTSIFVHLGLSTSAVDICYDVQDIDVLDKILLLIDSEYKSLYKLVRYPGGHVVNQQAGEVGQSATVPIETSQ